MMVLKMRIYFQIILFGIMISSVSFAQSARSLINEGVDLYHKGKAVDAEVNFKKGLEKEANSFTAKFNLGDAYYKQERYDEAIKSYQSALAESKTNAQKAEIYHNIGNTLLKDKKLDESIEAYKQALKLNPLDSETKYNLSYALKQKDDQKRRSMNNSGNRCPSAVFDVGRGPGNGAGGRNPAEEGHGDVSHPLGHQLHVGAVAHAGHAVGHHRGKQRFDGPQQGDGQGWSHQLRQHCPIQAGQSRHGRDHCVHIQGPHDL